MNPVLLDTGVIVALLGRDERHHDECVDALRTLSGPLVTCEAVLTECCHLLRGRGKAVETVIENVERGVFRMPTRLDEIAGPVRALMKRYARVPMSLADACLVHLAGELETGDILTLDHDFEIYRWGINKRFHLLL